MLCRRCHINPVGTEHPRLCDGCAVVSKCVKYWRLDDVDPETGVRFQAVVEVSQRCGNDYCDYPVWHKPWDKSVEYLCEFCRDL